MWDFQIYHTTNKQAYVLRLRNSTVSMSTWRRTRKGREDKSGERLTSEEPASAPSGTEVDSSVCQSFCLFTVILSSLPTWSLISLCLSMHGVTSQYFPPCYLLVWPQCMKPLSAHAQFTLPPSLSELSSYTSQSFTQSPCASKSLLFFCSIERNACLVACSSHS